jgi:hypothetical protein
VGRETFLPTRTGRASRPESSPSTSAFHGTPSDRHVDDDQYHLLSWLVGDQCNRSTVTGLLTSPGGSPTRPAPRPFQGTWLFSVGPDQATVSGRKFDEDSGIEALQAGLPSRLDSVPEGRREDPRSRKIPALVSDPDSLPAIDKTPRVRHLDRLGTRNESRLDHRSRPRGRRVIRGGDAFDQSRPWPSRPGRGDKKLQHWQQAAQSPRDREPPE